MMLFHYDDGEGGLRGIFRLNGQDYDFTAKPTYRWPSEHDGIPLSSVSTDRLATMVAGLQIRCHSPFDKSIPMDWTCRYFILTELEKLEEGELLPDAVWKVLYTAALATENKFYLAPTGEHALHTTFAEWWWPVRESLLGR